MQIDIGTDGKILGTKRVSANGQVSGFTEYAGAEVLVILPGGNLPIVRKDARDMLDEAKKLVEQRMTLAFQEYKNLRRRFDTPQKAADSFLKNFTPEQVRGLIDRTDEWLRVQLGQLEDQVGKRLHLEPRKKTKPKDGA